MLRMLPPHVSLISPLRESSIDTAELYCFDGCAGRGLSRNLEIAYQALFPAAFLFRFKQRRTWVPQGVQPVESLACVERVVATRAKAWYLPQIPHQIGLKPITENFIVSNRG